MNRHYITRIVGPFPPPIQGAAMINEQLQAKLAQRRSVEAFDNSAGSPDHSFRYHMSRIFRTFSISAKILACKNPQKILLSLDGGKGLVYNLLVATVCRLRGAELILYHHSTRYVYQFDFIAAALFTAAGKRALHVACSNAMLDMISDRYPAATNTLQINNSSWIESRAPSQIHFPKTLRMGYIGAIRETKGIFIAIEVFESLTKRNIQCTLEICGQFSDPATKRRFEQTLSKHSPKIVYTGIVDGKEKSDFFRRIDVLLFPSTYPHETQSLVVPEALSYSVPVAAINHRFVAEMISVGSGSLSSKELYVEETAEWLAELLESEQRYSFSRKEAYEQFRKTKEESEQHLDQLFDRLAPVYPANIFD